MTGLEWVVESTAVTHSSVDWWDLLPGIDNLARIATCSLLTATDLRRIIVLIDFGI